MPVHKITIEEYECAKCGYKWVNNRKNGVNGDKPVRCAKCKRWDWDEGCLKPIERRLRYQLLRIEKTVCTEIYTLFGPKNKWTVTDLCIQFFAMYPRPTIDELKLVIDPVRYLPRYSVFNRHEYWCDRNYCCCIGWNYDSATGKWNYDEANRKDMLKTESNARHQLMEHIINGRPGNTNTDSTHYNYLIMEKEVIEEMSDEKKMEEIHMLAAEELAKQNK